MNSDPFVGRQLRVRSRLDYCVSVMMEGSLELSEQAKGMKFPHMSTAYWLRLNIQYLYSINNAMVIASELNQSVTFRVVQIESFLYLS